MKRRVSAAAVIVSVLVLTLSACSAGSSNTSKTASSAESSAASQASAVSSQESAVSSDPKESSAETTAESSSKSASKAESSTEASKTSKTSKPFDTSAGEIDKDLLGTWAYSQSPDLIYTFTDDNKMIFSAYGSEQNLLYYTKDGVIYSASDENISPAKLPYTIEGDVLHLTDSFGNVIDYKKV